MKKKLNEWMHECKNQRKDELNKYELKRDEKWVNWLKDEWMNELINELINELTNESGWNKSKWMDELMNDSMDKERRGRIEPEIFY